MAAVFSTEVVNSSGKLAKINGHRRAQRRLYRAVRRGNPAAYSGYRVPAEVIHTSANSHTGKLASVCPTTMKPTRDQFAHNITAETVGSCAEDAVARVRVRTASLQFISRHN